MKIQGRYAISASFLAVVAISALIVFVNDRRTDKAIRKSEVAVLVAARANARAEAAIEVNRRQDSIRRELVGLFCEEIEGIKERIRATVKVNTRAEYAIILRRINPGIAEDQITALYNQARAQEQEVQERFAARNCATVPGG